MDYAIVEEATKRQVGHVKLPWIPDTALDAIELDGETWVVAGSFSNSGNRRIVVRRADSSELVPLGVRVLWRRCGMEMRPTYRQASGVYASPPAPSEGRGKSHFGYWRKRDEKEFFPETETVTESA